jgi:hypothetical protein
MEPFYHSLPKLSIVLVLNKFNILVPYKAPKYVLTQSCSLTFLLLLLLSARNARRQLRPMRQSFNDVSKDDNKISDFGSKD